MKSSSGCESVMLSLLSSSGLAPAPSASGLATLAPVTSMADFVFTSASVSRAPDGEFIKHNVIDF